MKKLFSVRPPTSQILLEQGKKNARYATQLKTKKQKKKCIASIVFELIWTVLYDSSHPAGKIL